MSILLNAIENIWSENLHTLTSIAFVFTLRLKSAVSSKYIFGFLDLKQAKGEVYDSIFSFILAWAIALKYFMWPSLQINSEPFPANDTWHECCQCLFIFCADPFADATKGDDRLPAGTEDYIHIRIQQRNGRKTLTTVQGIADDYDKKKLVKAFKKKFACNGTVIEHPEYGEVIQLQGDQRKNICQFLTDIELAKEEQLKVHGF